ncbi:hypothetical protein SUGI_0365010 [Cryptomeria japonica]|nr:hypothetical protein SUGI_0365010 [Cryptomeria japonica]
MGSLICSGKSLYPSPSHGKLFLQHSILLSHFVLAVYRTMVATIVFAPFAFFLERNSRTKMTFPIFCQIFALSLLGPLSNNFYYVGLKFTSPTFGSVMINLVPVTTFVIAFIFRMVKIRIGEIPSQSKIVGVE